jgi:hypothetical protein
MIVRPALLSQVAIEKIRLQTLAVIKPLQQAGEQIRLLEGRKRTDAGRSLPHYYFVYFLLVDLLGFHDSGMDEKVAWSVAVDYGGHIATIEHRKMGLGIFSAAMPQDETAAEEIVQAITRGVKVAMPYFNDIATRALQLSKVNVHNRSRWLFEKYHWFRDQFLSRLTAIDAIDYSLEHPPSPFGLRKEAEWLGVAAIEAFFSWSEHVLVHIAILTGKVTTGEEVEDLAWKSWTDKYKDVLDLSNKTTKQFYDNLSLIRGQIRNFIAHGSFGKQGQAFSFHSDAGAVPVNLIEAYGGSRFANYGNVSFDEKTALEMIDAFIEHLWSGPLAPAKMYIQNENLSANLIHVKDGSFRASMQSEEVMQGFIDYLQDVAARNADMDW